MSEQRIGAVDASRSTYQPGQEGLDAEFPQPAEHRQYRKQHLVAACRAFAIHGLDYGFAGHLTVRDPELPHLYWTNPIAVHFARVRVSNLILVDHEGRVILGSHAVNRAGFVLHAAVHEAHPDIVAMCHAHSVYGTAWAATGRLLDPITQDACAFFEDHVVIRDEAGQVAVEEGAGRSVSARFGDVKAAIHQNHGLLTVSHHSIDAAAFWFIALERCCRQQLAIEAAGIEPIAIPADHARYSREHVGSDYIGWLRFAPIYEQVAATQPDLFD